MSTASAGPNERTLTLEEYETLPDDPYYRDELSKGRVVREPPPGARHGRVAMNIAFALREYVGKHDLGSVEIDCGYILSREPPVVRGPDVSFIAKARLPAELPVRHWPFAPDLAIDVLSPSNLSSEIEIKIIEYLDAGTRMVWIVDPESRSARVYAGNEARIVREHEELDGRDVIPGFRVVLGSILP